MATPSFYKLSDEHREFLRHQPETGMGYQIVRQGSDGFVVSNGELLMTLEAGASPIIAHPELIAPAEPERFDGLEVVRSLKFADIFTSRDVSPDQPLQAGPPPPAALTPPFPYITRLGDEFVRLSAYPNDWRIHDDGSMAENTYTTTPTDLKMVPSGIAAVGRYALPNNMAACYVYRIIPPVGTEVYFGTVMPAYGFCGGGVEVFFPTALPKGSARLFKTIALM